MSLTIRRAVAGDAGLVLKFVRDLAEYEKLLHEVEATEADLARDMFGPNPGVYCEIAEWEGEPAGFALWYYTYSTFRGAHGIWLEDLFVAPQFRGKGMGKALIANLARRCESEGLARLAWWVLDWNTPAIEFYKTLGAAMQEDWTVCRVDGAALTALAAR